MSGDMKKAKSDIWKYFELNREARKTKCVLCKTELVYTGGTSSMRNHIKFRHKSASVESDKRQTTIGQYHAAKQALSKDRYNSITRSLALMCAIDLRPVSMIQCKGFINYTKQLNPEYKVPCRTTVTRHIQILYEECKKDLIELLHDCTVAMTTDMWTSVNMRAYITVTGHYITKDCQTCAFLEE